MNIKYPRALNEAAGLLAEAADARRAVIPAGRLSRLKNDPAAADPEALIISSRDLTEMTVEPENLLATAQAGLTPELVDRALKPTGLYWPVTGPGSRTLGAIMAEGALGLETMARGPMTDWILGTTLVDARGRVAASGGRTLKNVSGYDFTRITWRSWGRLAFNGAFILKLLPRPEAAPAAEIETGGPAEAAGLAREIITRRLAPEALRLVRSGGRTVLLVWLTGFSEMAAAKLAAVRDLAGGRELTVHEDGFAFWAGRGEQLGGRPSAWLGSRRALFELARRLDRDGGRNLSAELDFGGGRAELAVPDGLELSAHGLSPDAFTASGEVWRRLKKTLDPFDLMFPDRLGRV